MKTGTISVQISAYVKWWVPAYFNTLRLFAMTFNTEPDRQKVGEFIAKYGTAVKTKVVILQNPPKHPQTGA
ncbi:hypothetical protein FE392_01405 [Xenorhabdus sp. 12]|uniref:Transposase n=1 Tax=Xenorhabdus santafensis TaxID=2582833 RepID=A0ABU4S727_9GAMM|nr:hypothetical protein [Xenorhabdus sp. 12]